MNILIKIILSIVLFFLALLSEALPFFPGRILVKLGIYGAAIAAIIKIWRYDFMENGNIVDRKNERKNIIQTENNNIQELERQKKLIRESIEISVLDKDEAEKKLKKIDEKIKQINLYKKQKEEYENAKSKLDNLKNSGLITENDYQLKMKNLVSKQRAERGEDEWAYI